MAEELKSNGAIRGAKIQLSIMMFLQYAIWGAWAPVLSEYLMRSKELGGLGLNGLQVGFIYSLLPLATIISPFIGGQIADRYFPTQYVISFLQFIGGAMLIAMSYVKDYTILVWLMLIYCIFYAPTLALTNSIAFINLKNSEKEFGAIRVWGTVGWIAAGLILMDWRQTAPALALQGDTLFLAGVFSIIMGFTSFMLPHTPPKKEGTNPFAFLEAIKMLKNKNFFVFAIISFIVATELQFYYVLTSPFLTSTKIGVSHSAVSGVMVIAQIAEIFVMIILLPYVISKFGIRKTMVFGILAWPLRYIIFSIGYPSWLVIASLALHGFCYVFFFVAAYIYVDKVAPLDIRASAQSLIAIVILGFGNFVGSNFAGWIQKVFTHEGGTNWTGVFIIPTILTILCAVFFMLLFREKETIVPAETTGFNFGAFFVTSIWLIFHGRIVTGLIIILFPIISLFLGYIGFMGIAATFLISYIIISLYYGTIGNEIAMEFNNCNSLDDAKKIERGWNIAGIVIGSISILLIFFLYFIYLR